MPQSLFSLAAIVLVAAPPVAAQAGRVVQDPSGGEALSDMAYYTTEETISEASRVRLAFVELLDVPWVRDGGTRKWDLMTGPDLDVTVRTSDGYELAESRGPVVSDVVQGDFPMTFAIVGTPCFDLDERLVVYVADHDRTGSDLMFRTAPFSAHEMRPGEGVRVPLRTWTGTTIGAAYFEVEGWESAVH